MYKGQYSSTTHEKDLRELEHVIDGLLELPGMRDTWESSPLAKGILEPKFLDFVDAILAIKSE